MPGVHTILIKAPGFPHGLTKRAGAPQVGPRASQEARESPVSTSEGPGSGTGHPEREKPFSEEERERRL